MPMKNPHPGLSVRLNCLEPFGLSVTDGAKALGASRTTLSRLINGQARVSPGMAIRLAKVFGATPQNLDPTAVGLRASFGSRMKPTHADFPLITSEPARYRRKLASVGACPF